MFSGWVAIGGAESIDGMPSGIAERALSYAGINRFRFNGFALASQPCSIQKQRLPESLLAI